MANINKVQFLKDLLVPNLTVNGDLTVKGKSIVEDSTGKLIEDAFVVVNPNGEDVTTTLLGEVFVINNADAYAIAYDPNEDTIRLGKGTYDSSIGQFTFSEGEGQPIVTRNFSELTTGTLLAWDQDKHCLVESSVKYNEAQGATEVNGDLFIPGNLYIGEYGTFLGKDDIVQLTNLIGHNHDDVYADKNHNHDTRYALNEHEHDSITNSGHELRIDGATGELTFNGTTLTSDQLTQIINLINHNHDNSYAAKSHASSETTYGVGTTTYYGHVKISNGDVSTTTHTNGVVAGMDHTHSEYSQNNHTHTEFSDLDERISTLENGGNVVSEIYWGSF